MKKRDIMNLTLIVVIILLILFIFNNTHDLNLLKQSYNEHTHMINLS